MAEAHINPDQNLTGKIDVGMVFPEQEELEVTPTTERQIITPETYGFSKVEVEAVTNEIDSDIKAENIKIGVEILGVEGTYQGVIGQEKTINPSTEQQIITPDEGYNGITKATINPVTSAIDENIKAENIKQGVSILGVNGNGEILNAQTKNVTPSTSQQTITPDEEYNALSEVVVGAVDSSIDSNIRSSNIKAGVSILGVQGNVEPDKPDQTKTANPSTSTQVITPDIGYELASVTINPIQTESKNITPSTQSQTILPTEGKFINEVNVSAVDNTIDSNIVSSNIKQGVSILGINGQVIEKVGQNKTANPSTTQQVIEPDIGYNALNQVTIEPIETESKSVKSTTQSQTIIPTQGKFINEVVVNPIELEVKNVTPSTQSQTILPTSGKDGISQVNVSAINLQNKSVTITENGTTNVSADSGYDGLSGVAITTNVSGGSIVLPNGIKFSQTTASNMDFIYDLDFSNVTEKSSMFDSCYNVTELILDNFITATTTSISNMFHYCYKLETISLNNSNTSNVRYSFSDIFNGCNVLKRLDVSSFTFPANADTNFNLNRMFKDCSVLEFLDISGLDFTSQAGANYHGQLFYNVPVNCLIYVKDQTAVNKLTLWDNTHTYTIKP